MDMKADTRTPMISADDLMDPATRARVRDLIEEGRRFVPALAEWSRRARPLLDHPLPEDAYEQPVLAAAVREATGLGELNDVMFVIGLVGGDPYSAPSDAVVERLCKEYADLIDGANP